MSFAFFVAGLALPLLHYFLLFLHQCFKLRFFRGPFALPLVGNCYNSEATSVIKFLTKLRKNYGKIFTFFSFTKPYLVICDPIAVRRILSDPKTFIKGEDYTKTFGTAFGDGLVTSSREKHRKDKAMFSKYFVPSYSAKSTQAINATTTKAIDEIIPTDEQAFDIEEFFAAVSLRVFLNCSIGQDFSKDLKAERTICHNTSKGSYLVAFMIFLQCPIWRIIPIVNRLMCYKEDVIDILKTVVDERKRKHQE